MNGSKRLNLAQVRDILRLGRRLRAANDPLTRKRRLLEGLCQLVGGNIASCTVHHSDRDLHHPRIVSTTTVMFGGQANEDAGAAREKTGESASFLSDNGQATEWAASVHLAARPIARLRRTRRSSGCIVSSLNFDGAGLSATVRICCVSERFSVTDRELANLVHLEMSWIYEPDVLLAAAKVSTLSPRQRQTLELLLAGDGEKQIASKLRLSHNTVHHYVKALHRHFGVSSRSELLAKWVNR